MPETGYFIDDYVAYASSRTDAPKVFHKYMAYLTLSCTLGRKAYLEFAGDRVYPNMYVLIIAPSTLFRKSTSLGIALQVIRRVDDHIRLPDDLSSESLVKVLQKAGTGLIYSSEFLKLLHMFQKEYAQQIKPILTDIYDCPEEYPVPFRMKDPTADLQVIQRPVVNIASATVSSWLLEAASADDMKGGFLSRFLYVVADTKEQYMPRPPGASEAELMNLAQRLKYVQTNYWNPTNSPMLMDDEAGARFDTWSEEFSNQIENDPRCKEVQSALGRIMVYTLKFAMMECVMRCQMVINIEDIERAIALTLECKEGLIKAMSDLQDSQNDARSLLKKARKYLQNHTTCSRKDMMKTLNLYEKETEHIISTMKMSGEVRVIEGRNGSMMFQYLNGDGHHEAPADMGVRYVAD